MIEPKFKDFKLAIQKDSYKTNNEILISADQIRNALKSIQLTID